MWSVEPLYHVTFSGLKNSRLHWYTTVNLSNHQLMGIWFIFIFCTMLLWTFCVQVFVWTHVLNSLEYISGVWKEGKESACNAGDLGLIPGLGRCPGVGHGNSLQYSCLKNPRGQMSFAGYSSWDCRVGHDWATKHSTGVYGVPFSPHPINTPIFHLLNYGYPGGVE